MTLQDELTRMTAQAAREGDVRTPPLKDWEGDCTEVTLGTNEYDKAVIIFHHENVVVHESDSPFSDKTFDFTVPYPKGKLQTNSVLGQILLNAEANGVGDNPLAFVGKRIRWSIDHIIPAVEGRDGKMVNAWISWGPRLAGSAAKSNGSSVPAPADGVAAALDLLSGEGRTVDSFGLAAMKTLGAYPALVKAIADGSFVSEQIAAGKVVKDGDILRLA